MKLEKDADGEYVKAGVRVFEGPVLSNRDGLEIRDFTDGLDDAVKEEILIELFAECFDYTILLELRALSAGKSDSSMNSLDTSPEKR